MAEVTTKAFPVALTDLIGKAGISQREVSRRTKRAGGKGLSHVTVGALAGGRMDPTQAAMETLAEVLGVEPNYFVEYRLMKARQALDPRVVGFRRAVSALGNLPANFGV